MGIVQPQSLLDVLAVPLSEFWETATTEVSTNGVVSEILVKDDLRQFAEGETVDTFIARFTVQVLNLANRDGFAGTIGGILKQLYALGFKAGALVGWAWNTIFGLADNVNLEDFKPFGFDVIPESVEQGWNNFVENITLDNEGVAVIGMLLAVILFVALVFIGLRISPRAVPIIGNALQVIVGIIRRITGVIAGVFS